MTLRKYQKPGEGTITSARPCPCCKTRKWIPFDLTEDGVVYDKKAVEEGWNALIDNCNPDDEIDLDLCANCGLAIAA
jgi:hypothetical protein